MTSFLTDAQTAQFRDSGYLFPCEALSGDEAAHCLARLEEIEAKLGDDPQKYLKIKAHLAAPWLVDLATNDAILDAVESLIGPDILLFGSSLFAKQAYDNRFVSWHQDSAYYGLSPHEEVTVWLALTDATEENGCMRVLPGSHLGPDLEHEETFDPQNLLSRGQTIRSLEENKATFMPLRAGQFSLHHERTAHSSLGNQTAMRRVGLALFYMPAHVVSTTERRSALLVRGSDRYNNWDPDPLPREVLDPDCMRYLQEIWARYQDPSTQQAARANG